MTATLSKQEFLGDMPANKTYTIRQAYWWVFTHPGCFAGCVVEIREYKNHGAAPRVRRYSVQEHHPDSNDGRRKFVFTKPTKEWKPDERKTYEVWYRPGSRKSGAGENWCSCDGFERRQKCSHLEALLSLTNRTPGPAVRHQYTQAGQPHDWERRGVKSYKCRNCGMRAWNADMVDRSEHGVCHGSPHPAHVRDQEPPAKPVKAMKTVRRCPGCGSAACFNEECKANVRRHEFKVIKGKTLTRSGEWQTCFRCDGCKLITTKPEAYNDRECPGPSDPPAATPDRPRKAPRPDRAEPLDRPARKPPKTAPSRAERGAGKGKPQTPRKRAGNAG